ncbi:DUF1003 domain-containing protein [Microvirga thermotolerans]|uniref:DUF1003 domain-containing protein n=1 Tax=Microvirga thermotolerans TaxID=2651334 RepID=A0A5P9JZA2_9HYPH|nr:DUF1003 domain-containing protein [Microvirga thermotolerans]QFU17481.1 DUF1003 domain-containing protein [Microvirga thermotolerans]
MNTEVRFLAQHLLHAGLSPLDARDRRVIARVARRVHTARNLNREFDDRLTMGQRLADRVAAIGGSWGFIVGFAVFLGAWALLNVVLLKEGAFDPYPFVFLNLLLSMLAALQAPVIMMSQNRQAAKDRLAAALDYEVNLKSEMEIASLSDKMDALQAQMERLLALHAANSNAKSAGSKQAV